MNKKTHRISAIILSAVIIISLIVSCSNDVADENHLSNEIYDNQTLLNSSDTYNGHNSIQKLQLPESLSGLVDFRAFAYMDNVLYICGAQERDRVEITSIYAVNLDTNDVIEFSYNEPLAEKMTRFIELDQDLNLWVLEAISEYIYPEVINEERTQSLTTGDSLIASTYETYRLIRFNLSGEVDKIVDIDKHIRPIELFIFEENIGIVNIINTDVFNTQYELILLDTDGNILLEVSLDQIDPWSITASGSSVIAGNAAIDQHGVSGISGISLLNVEEQTFYSIADINAELSILRVSAYKDAIYLRSLDSLYLYNVDSADTKFLLNWEDAGLSGTYTELFERANDSLLYCDFNAVYVVNVAAFRNISSSTVQDSRETLFLATLDSTIVKDIVFEFNMSNDNYIIKIDDYSVHNITVGSSEGLTKLVTEIIAGNVPDIIDLRNIPYDIYEKNRLLADLMPYLENDSDFSVSDFEPAVLNAMMENGMLYNFTPLFSVLAVFGNKSDTEMGTAGSFNDLTAIVESGEFFSMYTRSDIMKFALGSSNSKFFDFDTGQCRFDSNEFIEFLEFCKTQTDDGLEIFNNLLPTHSLRFFYAGVSDIPVGLRNWFTNDDIGLVGMPSSGGGGGVIMPDNFCSIGMSSVSEHKDGVWEFMKYTVSDEFIAQYYVTKNLPFCIRKSVNEESRQEYRRQMADGQINGMPADERDIILAQEILNSVTGMYRFNEGLYNLVMEDASAFFNGISTAEQAAEIIQSRASIYMSERR